MKSLFVNPRAYAPFFDEMVAVSGVRPNGGRVNTSARACVIDNGFDETLGDGDPANTRRSFSITILRREWRYTTSPQVGDTVTLSSSATALAVKSVETDDEFFHLEARS